MNTYLVGGYIRDLLLKIKSKDKDYLVVGATEEQLISKGFLKVGNGFPVFIHPETKNEYALARKEVKKDQGYKGFEFQTGSDITLEEDLLRRDITINAIAQDENGNYHDPYNGIQDLKNKIIKHVSPAFSEDPLRVLRVARFAAKLHHLGFKIAPETIELIREICRTDEINHLTPERVWMETEKALETKNPEVFFQTLKDIDGLEKILPEIDNLFGVPQPEKWHPEIDTGIHTMLCLKQITKLSDQASTRFAVLCHDVGKAVTPKELWPKHHNHDRLGLPIIKNMCAKYKIPNKHKEIAMLVCEFHQLIHKAKELKAETIIKILNKANQKNNPERFDEILLACIADSKGRTGFETTEHEGSKYIKQVIKGFSKINTAAIINEHKHGKSINTAINNEKIAIINEIKNKNQLSDEIDLDKE